MLLLSHTMAGILGRLFLAAVLAVATCGCDSAKTSAGPSSVSRGDEKLGEPPLRAPSSPAAAESVRADLFEAAMRAAYDFEPGKEVAISTELELIELRVKGEKEGAIFKALKLVEDAQTDLNALEIARAVTEKVVSDYRSLSPLARGLAAENAPSYTEEMEAFSAVLDRGGVAVSSRSSVEMYELMEPFLAHLEEFSYAVQDLDGMKWVSYEETRQFLRALERASLETAKALIAEAE